MKIVNYEDVLSGDSSLTNEEDILMEEEILAVFKKYFDNLVKDNPILKQYEQQFRYIFFMGFNEGTARGVSIQPSSAFQTRSLV